MSSHVELNPDDSTLSLSLGMKAMRLALTQKTHKMGTVRIPGTGGTDVIIGDGAQDGANRIDQDGNQLPLVDTSGIDKAAQDAQQSADKAMTKADEAIAKGEQIRRDAQAGIEDARKQAQTADAKADQVRTDLETAASQLESNIAAVDKKADQVRSDLTRQVQNAKSEMDSTVKAAQSSADKAQSAADAAQKAADKANASTADLDKSIQAVDAKAIAAKQAAAEAQSKAENVASDLDSANAVIEQHTTELGELTTKVSNAVKKSDSALSVSTEAKQTATEASTTATSAYADAQTALTQSTTATQTATAAKTTAESASKTANDSLKQSSAAVQTANQISTTLKTEYQTKADADKIYATQSSLKQTSDSITASVSKTYATKDALSTLQNVADNAIESWQGTGVPTLTNKPASDWTTDAKRKKHSGDLYYDKATGKAYRFGSDDGKTYTWELNQDTDVTKALADASKAQTSATAANTAAGKAQSTANTAAANAATAKNAADAAQSSANKAQGDVDKLKIDIPETYATKSSLTQTAESITANVESVKTTANSAVTAASKAQQTADGISANLTKNYQTKSQADTIYATKASLKATSDSISAEVTKAQGTADGAVTAASKAQQTADAVTLNLSKNYNTKAQNDALYATKTSLKATSDSLSAKITANAKTAQSAVDKATSLEANLNGFKTTVAETYQTKSGMSAYATNSSLTQTANSIKAQVAEVSKTANGAMSKATTVEQTANGLSSKITEQGKTLNATVTTANEAKSTADSNKTAISQVSTTASNALSKASTVEQNLNGFKTTVSETYTTKTDFNSLQIGGTNLCPKSNPYNISLSNASKDSSGVITGTVPTNANVTWGASVTPGYATHLKTPYGRQCVISFDVWSEIAATVVVDINNMPESVAAWNGNDNDGWRGGVQPTTTTTTNGAAACSIPAKQWIRLWVTYSNTSAKNTGKVDIFDQSHIGLRPASAAYQVKFKDFKFELGSRPTEYSPCPSDLQSAGDYATNSSLTQAASQIRSEVAEKYQSKSGMSSYATTSALTQKANEITGKVQEVAKTAQGNTTTISQVSQKADKINTTLSQKIDGKADVSRVSSLEQSLSGFKTSVAQSYQPKGDYPTKTEMQSNISQSASSIKSEVANTYTTQTATEALRKSATRTFTLTGAAGKAKWVKLGYLTSNGDDSSVLIHVYSGNGCNGQASQNAEFEIFVKDGWQQSASATSAFGVSVSRIRNADDVKVKVMAFSSCTCDIWAYLPWAYWNGHYTLHGNYKSWQDGPNCGGTRIQDAEPTSGTAQDLAYDTLSTRSYVDQTAKSVALGVVQNYQGSDGSGLATKSDITAAKASVTSTVASTYATKTGVTQEISSKITQNNNSLDVKFATKVETQNAQNKANTADSHATNAQSRVGSLEDCINFTASGVRVGKRSNGKFTGVSALVNTNGTFDLLDASGNLLTRINQHRFQVTGDDGTGGGYLSLSQDGINITVQPTADASKTYHIQVGKSGVGITAPDGSSIGCSASGGLNIETVKYGKISIGAGGLQFTNDQGWGLRLSAAGWSLKWAGNHTLATGPAAGKLYIDGREIVTR